MDLRICLCIQVILAQLSVKYIIQHFILNGDNIATPSYAFNGFIFIEQINIILIRPKNTPSIRHDPSGKHLLRQFNRNSLLVLEINGYKHTLRFFFAVCIFIFNRISPIVHKTGIDPTEGMILVRHRNCSICCFVMKQKISMTVFLGSCIQFFVI